MNRCFRKKNNIYEYKMPLYDNMKETDNYKEVKDFINKYYKWEQYLFDFVIKNN